MHKIDKEEYVYLADDYVNYNQEEEYFNIIEFIINGFIKLVKKVLDR